MKRSWKRYRDCLIAAFHAMRERSVSKDGVSVSGGMLRVRLDTLLFPGMASEAPVPELVCEFLEEKLMNHELKYQVEGPDSETRTRACTLQSAFLIGSRMELIFSIFRAIPQEDVYPILNQLADITIQKIL